MDYSNNVRVPGVSYILSQGSNLAHSNSEESREFSKVYEESCISDPEIQTARQNLQWLALDRSFC